MKQLKINLYGYVNNNLGDDLFFQHLANRYSSNTFNLFAPSMYSDTFNCIDNIRLIYPTKVKRVLNKFYKILFKKNLNFYTNKADISLLVGGSLFMENKDWKIVQHEFVNKFSASKNNYLLGANFGPYTSLEFYDSYKKKFVDFEDICFREKYTENLFKDLKNVRVAPDILFGFKSDKLKINEEKKVFISVIKPSYRKDLIDVDMKYYKGIAMLVKKYLSEGYEISLVSFCQAEGDEDAIDEIYSLLEKKTNIDRLYYKGFNRNEILKELARSEIIVATRFHAMILGWVFNKKVLPLIYSNKTLNVIKDVEFKGVYIDIKEGVDYNINVNDIGTLENVDSIALESEKHFEVLDKLINY